MKVRFCIFLFVFGTGISQAFEGFPSPTDIFTSTESPYCKNCEDGDCLNDDPIEDIIDSNIIWRTNTLGPKGELPAMPGAKGFGVYTRPAKNAKVYKVTNLNASGDGSLKDCIDKTGARVCVFEVSGRIRHTKTLRIENDNLHIAGQTAPSPGIVIHAPATTVAASNVVIEHLRLMSSDELTNNDLYDTKGYDNRDVLQISNSKRAIKNVVINHVTMTFGIDGILGLWYEVDNVSIRNSLMGLVLNFSIHADVVEKGWNSLENHPLHTLIGHEVNNVDMTRNVIAYAEGRLPRSGAANLFYSENVNYGTDRNKFVDLYTRDGEGYNKTTGASVVGNVFITDRDKQKIVNLRAESEGNIDLYFSQNQLQLNYGKKNSTPSASQAIFHDGGKYKLRSSSLALPHPKAKPTKPIAENDVLDLVGARPSQRIPLESEVISNIKNRKGELINCYSETGDARFDKVLADKRYGYDDHEAPSIAERCELDKKGWTGWKDWLLPTSVVNRRTISSRLPATNELSDILPSGYSKLEAFLHACSRKVELNHGECDKDFIDNNGREWLPK